MEVRKAVIPAAGFGTRFLPATKAQPKEMLPIVDKPTIHYVIEEILNAGIEDILIITGRGKRAIEDYFDKNIELEEHLAKSGNKNLLDEICELSDMADIHYVRQKEQLGLGHAILCAEKHIGGEPFAVLLGDTIIKSRQPCTRQLIELYRRYSGSIIAVEKVPKEEVRRYGIVVGKRLGDSVLKIESLVEKPDPKEATSDLGIIGRYVLTPEIFDALKETRPGKNNEIQLTDGLSILSKMQDMYACLFEGKRYDIGDKLDYVKAIVEFSLERSDIGPAFRDYLRQLQHAIETTGK